MTFDGFSLAPLAAELNTKLAGARIDKIFQPDKYTLILWLRQPGENLYLVMSVNPERPYVHLTAAPPSNPATPPAFCMLLRKHLEDGRIAAVSQHELDRILRILIDVRGEGGAIITKELILEVMGKHSNIILTIDNVIVDAIRRIGLQLNRFRQVLPGRPYLLPPGQSRLNLFNISAAAFVEKLIASQTGLLTKAIISTAMGIGPVTARELVWRAGLPATIEVAALDAADAASLADAIDSLTSAINQGKIEATVVLDDNERLVGMAAFWLHHLAQYHVHTFSTMSAAIEFAKNLPGAPASPDKSLLQKTLTTEIARLQRKQTALADELKEALTADDLRKTADLIMANLYAIPPNSSEIVLPDLFSDQPETAQLTVKLDPQLTALENAQTYYGKYNKFKRAQELLTMQLEQCQAELSYLESVAVSLDHATANDELQDIRQELITGGYLKDMSKRRHKQLSQPLMAVSSDGTTILIGKNNRQNDALTKQAQHDDIWLHTKNIPGSHVIIKAHGAQVSDTTLLEAAHLAAYYSKARHSTNVSVDYTRRKYVKKPAAAKPGFVIYDHQTTLYITPDETIVNKIVKK